MHALARELAARASGAGVGARRIATIRDLLDAELARGFLEIQLAENASAHGVARQSGAVDGRSGLLRHRADDPRLRAARRARSTPRPRACDAIPAFLAMPSERRRSATTFPRPWIDRSAARVRRRRRSARRAASTRGSRRGDIAPASTRARCRAARRTRERAFARFADWLARAPTRPTATLACGAAMFDVLLARGHHCTRSRADLLADARDAIRRRASATRRRWRVRSPGRGPDAQEQLAADHPSRRRLPRRVRVARGTRVASARHVARCRDVAGLADSLRAHSRSGRATRRRISTICTIDRRRRSTRTRRTTTSCRRCRATPRRPSSTCAPGTTASIKLNHVVHHGAIGHHVQNWHAYHRARSRVGKIAAVDCASRIGMFCGGTMAEGWACYATRADGRARFPHAARARVASSTRACASSRARSSTSSCIRARCRSTMPCASTPSRSE